jgi:hypothetical protein
MLHFPALDDKRAEKNKVLLLGHLWGEKEQLLPFQDNGLDVALSPPLFLSFSLPQSIDVENTLICDSILCLL